MPQAYAPIVRMKESSPTVHKKADLEFTFRMPKVTKFLGECLTRLLFNGGYDPNSQEVDKFMEFVANKRAVRFVIRLYDDGGARGRKNMPNGN